MARDDEPVAAVVAGAAHDDDAGVDGVAVEQLADEDIGRAASRVLHEQEAGDTTDLDGALVERAHLLAREDGGHGGDSSGHRSVRPRSKLQGGRRPPRTRTPIASRASRVHATTSPTMRRRSLPSRRPRPSSRTRRTTGVDGARSPCRARTRPSPRRKRAATSPQGSDEGCGRRLELVLADRAAAERTARLSLCPWPCARWGAR